ncbi:MULTISPECIES: hypothetical protein [Bacillus cereus group]|uniref:hypothetical protein n=1 Tax=Bacillus cereus group TaxID=86661 RepID=UPI00156AE1B6|nr:MULTISPECIES: hypothetical protein [Bacillus cereus group]NRR14088.1 hypothetical protein [Bacillus pacificus]
MGYRTLIDCTLADNIAHDIMLCLWLACSVNSSLIYAVLTTVFVFLSIFNSRVRTYLLSSDIMRNRGVARFTKLNLIS